MFLEDGGVLGQEVVPLHAGLARERAHEQRHVDAREGFLQVTGAHHSCSTTISARHDTHHRTHVLCRERDVCTAEEGEGAVLKLHGEALEGTHELGQVQQMELDRRFLAQQSALRVYSHGHMG